MYGSAESEKDSEPHCSGWGSYLTARASLEHNEGCPYLTDPQLMIQVPKLDGDRIAAFLVLVDANVRPSSCSFISVLFAAWTTTAPSAGGAGATSSRPSQFADLPAQQHPADS